MRSLPAGCFQSIKTLQSSIRVAGGDYPDGRLCGQPDPAGSAIAPPATFLRWRIAEILNKGIHRKFSGFRQDKRATLRRKFVFRIYKLIQRRSRHYYGNDRRRDRNRRGLEYFVTLQRRNKRKTGRIGIGRKLFGQRVFCRIKGGLWNPDFSECGGRRLFV